MHWPEETNFIEKYKRSKSTDVLTGTQNWKNFDKTKEKKNEQDKNLKLLYQQQNFDRSVIYAINGTW